MWARLFDHPGSYKLFGFVAGMLLVPRILLILERFVVKIWRAKLIEAEDLNATCAD
jgi:hypothetical protein